MKLFKSKLLKKNLFFKSTILIFGSITLLNPVFSNPIEFNCTVTGSFGVKNRTTMNPKGKKVYPTKLAKNVFEKFEKFKVIFDISKGEGTINGSGAIILSKIQTSKDKGPKRGPIILAYSRTDIVSGNLVNDMNGTFRTQNVNTRYLILDKGTSTFSRFTLMDTAEDSDQEIRINQNKKKFNIEKNILHETYYGGCKQPKN